MCGIAGFSAKNEFPEKAREIITDMTMSLKHRGPDRQDVHLSPPSKTALGHTRLSIIDLSEAGNQPMTSPCGNYSLVFNGEIYNYQELKILHQKNGVQFKGNSDTEVLFHSLKDWGIKETLDKINGMFAFAFLDVTKGELFLARDRMGIKPLFYGFSNSNFLFASELKALKAHPAFNNSISQQAISLFLRHNTIPAPWSIYENIFQLKAGCYLRFSLQHFEITKLEYYWDLKAISRHNFRHHLTPGIETFQKLEEEISKSIKYRMQADVPYGAFLSGGIDSSLVVALMQKQTSERVKTFSIGFEEAAYNEADDAARVAQHLNTDHHNFTFTSNDALSLIPNLSTIYDQPFADSSQLPTYLLSKMAREHVTICLSGDGGDELFAGYERYQWGLRALKWYKNFSPLTRYVMANCLTSLSPKSWDSLGRNLSFLPGFRSKRMGEKVYKLAKVLHNVNRFSLYRTLSSVWQNPDEILLNSSEPLTALTDEQNWIAENDFIKQAQYIDQMLYLPDDILHKVDRASMAHALEVRVPLIDYHLVELSWKFTDFMNIKNGKGKAPLRHILAKYVPENLWDRPKTGFGVPVGDWLRGPLKEWSLDLLAEDRLTKQGIFKAKPILKVLQEHLKGKENHPEQLWGILMLQSWLDNNK